MIYHLNRYSRNAKKQISSLSACFRLPLIINLSSALLFAVCPPDSLHITNCFMISCKSVSCSERYSLQSERKTTWLNLCMLLKEAKADRCISPKFFSEKGSRNGVLRSPLSQTQATLAKPSLCFVLSVALVWSPPLNPHLEKTAVRKPTHNLEQIWQIFARAGGNRWWHECQFLLTITY